MLLSPIHCCDVTKPPYLRSGELCTSPLHSNRLYLYTVCCLRGGQCFSVLRTSHTDVVGVVKYYYFINSSFLCNRSSIFPLTYCFHSIILFGRLSVNLFFNSITFFNLTGLLSSRPTYLYFSMNRVGPTYRPALITKNIL